MNSLSKSENGRISYDIVLLTHAPQKNAEKNCICLLFNMLSCVPAAITLRVYRVYIEEGLYEVHVGLEVNLRGLVGWIVDFGKKPESSC